MNDRRTFLKNTGLAGLAGLLPTSDLLADDFKNKAGLNIDYPTTWPDGSRLVVSVSM